MNTYPITGPPYTDLALVNGTTYYYVVKTVDSAGLLSVASNEVSAKPSSKLPSARLDLDEPPVERLAAMTSSDATAGMAPYASTGQMSLGNVKFLHTDHLGSVRLVRLRGIVPLQAQVSGVRGGGPGAGLQQPLPLRRLRARHGIGSRLCHGEVLRLDEKPLALARPSR